MYGSGYSLNPREPRSKSPGSEARDLAGWLRSNRSTEYRSEAIHACGAASRLIIESADPRFAVRLDTTDEIATLRGQLVGTLGLILGRPIDPMGP
jgi:hypothetical protein